MGDSAQLEAAIDLLRLMESAARKYTSESEGWSENVGLFFHIYGHASVAHAYNGMLVIPTGS